MERLIVPLNRELKKFDLELINNLALNHPYQKTMFMVYWGYDFYIHDEEDEDQNDMLNCIDYFQLLDRYYRYGITFEDKNLYPQDFLEIPFNNKLYVYDGFKKNYQFCYLISLSFGLSLKDFLINDVKTINLDDVDNGPITLSEVEKWKRKVVNQQTDRKKKLQLLDPNIYHSLVTFVVFSKFEGRPHNEFDYELSEEEF